MNEFPKSPLSFASEDFWYKEPWRNKGIVDGRESGGVGGVGKEGGGVDRRGMMEIKFKPTEKQTQQMRQQQTHE